MVGGENFSLARPHGGDAIARARHDREGWLRAMQVVTSGSSTLGVLSLSRARTCLVLFYLMPKIRYLTQ
eukprot:4595390-Pleurochrysis_carterae.AAC.1